MNPLWGHVIGAVIVLLMLAFLGIWAWAWLPYHRDAFAKLAQVPMNDPLDARASTADEDARQ
jgi:cytochrome c oxidase cbb3-type subunit 4